MKDRIAPLVGSIIFASSLSLSAQTFTEAPPNSGINTFARVDGFPVGGPNPTGPDGIVFNNVTGTSVNPYEIDPIGITITELTTSAGTFTAYDFCVELFVGPNDSSSYSVTQGFGSLSSNQQVLIAKLFSNTLGSFISTSATGTRSEAAVIGAAIQLALWEIVEDQVDLSNPSLNESGSTPGDLSILGYSSNYAPETKDAMELAETYLSQVIGWNDEGGLSYYYADNATDQNRLWVTIPEPSSALLGLLGMGFLLRRKRD